MAVSALRRLLVFAAALAAVVAFAALARPEGSSSARISIGASDTDEADEADEAGEAGEAGATAEPRERAAQGGDFGNGSFAGEVLLRPIDPSTLADRPANLLTLGPSDWPFPSHDGALLAVPDSQNSDVGEGDLAEVDVLDARTFQPVASVDLEGAPIAGFLGFTPEADAVVVQRSDGGTQTLTRHPLDPSEGTTTVALPEQLDVNAYQWAMLEDGRVALLAVERGGDGEGANAPLLRVLVADLLAERVVVDLPLPGVRADQSEIVLQDGPLYFPGAAWDAAGERLYLAHADTSRVTVVDLASGGVAAEADLDSRAPGTEGLAADSSRRKQAQLSPDGSRLYVTGHDYPRNGPGEPGEPLGLSVIDTATMTEVEYVSGVSYWVQMSPDGRWLAWTAEATDSDTEVGADGDRPSSRVGLLHTETLEPVALLGDGYRSSYALGFSRDSAHIYLQSDDPNGGNGGTVVRAHALPSLVQTGERRLSGQSWFDPGGGYLRQVS